MTVTGQKDALTVLLMLLFSVVVTCLHEIDIASEKETMQMLSRVDKKKKEGEREGAKERKRERNYQGLIL